MRFDAVPMPERVGERPRDVRGYPVPAITPWRGGEPQFALTDHERSANCALERLCSVCGGFMAQGPVWRVVGAAESAAIGAALAEGRPYRNLAPTMEGPGHRACMLYAAMVCPYLARPNARRRAAAHGGVDGLTAAAVRGAVRGGAGAVVGFGDYEFAVTESRVLFRFLDPVEFLPHESADEQLPALRAELASRGGL
ncbi:hypothetical protein ACFV84_11770 [Kitasatospora sp. NPDC059811]|uniref:hypothetical protein n=1 Tax=Streptomycetaceae TaxID=2062 RepID=UPI000B218D10|nr:hypothetical protein [Streptomyces sp. MJM8645]